MSNPSGRLITCKWISYQRCFLANVCNINLNWFLKANHYVTISIYFNDLTEKHGYLLVIFVSQKSNTVTTFVVISIFWKYLLELVFGIIFRNYRYLLIKWDTFFVYIYMYHVYGPWCLNDNNSRTTVLTICDMRSFQISYDLDG